MAESTAGRLSAADLDRSAKSDAEHVRSVLQNGTPWAKQVELYRQQCRNTHLTLLFSHPLSPHSQSLDALWLHTTYILIQAYRDLIARLERTDRRGELKKAVTRFRQALASEETFYRSLIARLVKFYGLGTISSIQPVLRSVKLPADSAHHNDSSVHTAPAEKATKVSLVYKGLICLGDLERYKEQYRAQQNGQGKNERDKFEMAEKYYLAAWSLFPDDGSAWNQLAVISTYIPNHFATTYYYFRALAVKNAFKGADHILAKFLSKSFDRWRARKKEEKDGEDQVRAVGGKGGDNGVEWWKDEMVVLVGIIYLKAGFTYIPSLLPNLLRTLKTNLSTRHFPTETIVHLTSILIGSHFRARSTAGLVTGANSSTELKLIQRGYEAEGKALELLLQVGRVYLEVATEQIREARASMSAGLEGSATLDDEADLDIETDFMPQLISAPLRRILPSLRILSKWLKLHSSYLSSISDEGPAAASLTSSTSATAAQSLRDAIDDFWTAYQALLDSLARVFVLDRLPELIGLLEEDNDMRGFAPLHKGITPSRDAFASGGSATEREDGAGGLDGTASVTEGREKLVHPNEEHLMRLSDIQIDGKLILGLRPTETSLNLTNTSFPLADLESERDHDLASISTRTEDDPVTLAMRATLGVGSVDEDEYEEYDEEESKDAFGALSLAGTAQTLNGAGVDHDDEDDDDEDEVIVWGMSAQIPAEPPVPTAPRQMPSTQATQVEARPQAHSSSPAQPQTAADLLLNLLNPSSSTPQPSHAGVRPVPASGSPATLPGQGMYGVPGSGFAGVGSGSSGMNSPAGFPADQGFTHTGQDLQQQQSQPPGLGSGSLFLGGGAQGGNIWSLMREESEKGKARRFGPVGGGAAGDGVDAPGPGLAPGLGGPGIWDSIDSHSAAPPPGLSAGIAPAYPPSVNPLLPGGLPPPGFAPPPHFSSGYPHPQVNPNGLTYMPQQLPAYPPHSQPFPHQPYPLQQLHSPLPLPLPQAHAQPQPPHPSHASTPSATLTLQAQATTPFRPSPVPSLPKTLGHTLSQNSVPPPGISRSRPSPGSGAKPSMGTSAQGTTTPGGGGGGAQPQRQPQPPSSTSSWGRATVASGGTGSVAGIGNGGAGSGAAAVAAPPGLPGPGPAHRARTPIGPAPPSAANGKNTGGGARRGIWGDASGFGSAFGKVGTGQGWVG